MQEATGISTSNIFKTYREEQEIIERIELSCSERRKELNHILQELNQLQHVQIEEEENLYELRVVSYSHKLLVKSLYYIIFYYWYLLFAISWSDSGMC